MGAAGCGMGAVVGGNPRVDGEAVESGAPGVGMSEVSAGSRISAMGARSPRKGLETTSSTRGSVFAADCWCLARLEEAICRP
jgi:hypothetical protein